jgi:hypothetical protein
VPEHNIAKKVRTEALELETCEKSQRAGRTFVLRRVEPSVVAECLHKETESVSEIFSFSAQVLTSQISASESLDVQQDAYKNHSLFANVIA